MKGFPYTDTLYGEMMKQNHIPLSCVISAWNNTMNLHKKYNKIRKLKKIFFLIFIFQVEIKILSTII